MTAATRKEMGKLWKMGDKRLGPEFEKYYLEFQKEIDTELNPKPAKADKVAKNE